MTDREKWIGAKGYYQHSSGRVVLSRPLHSQAGRRISGSENWTVYENRDDSRFAIAGPLSLREAKIRGQRAVREIIMRGSRAE